MYHLLKYAGVAREVQRIVEDRGVENVLSSDVRVVFFGLV